MLITGLVIFAITSLAAGLAPSASLLAAARLAQGVGAGLVQPQTFGFIQQLFRGQERGRAFGVFGATMGLANALGPVVGGLIITVGGPANGWRWVFGINLPIIAVVIVFALRLLQDPITLRTNLTVRRQSFRPELDPVGLLLITGAALTFMMPFMTTSGTQGALRWGWLGVSAVLALALLRWEPRYQLRTGEAVLDPALLGDESFRSGVLLGMIYFAGFTPVFLVVSLFLQSDLGFGALRAGLVTAPWAAVAALSAWRSGRWLARWGRALVVGGLLVVVIGVTGAAITVHVLAASSRTGLTWLLAGCLAAAGFGSGLVISPNQTLSLADVPVSRAGVAGSMQQLGQRVGGAAGVAVVLATFSAFPRDSGHATAAMAVIAAIMGVALTIGIYDARRRSRRRAPLSSLDAPCSHR